ncbi:VOC family protein [Pseudonocardia eucalypti]|uniref:VOC family protein n=1 Tax=Pseudonocardia eucalypti TaxID=648755 RepID=A0ABP9Q095_9PSEU|nr:catechol 2,3-dioxygenase-like lactoylglutathione lyase family enzyme [Pseudonocardia eucalypti]
MATALNTGHIGLNVTDLDVSVAFYQRLFGFEARTGGRDGQAEWAFLSRDGRLVLTLWRQSAGVFDTGAPGLHHLSFQVDTLDEVRAVEANLRELGLTPRHGGAVPHGEGADSGGVFFTDPDGIRLEVYTPAGLAEDTAAKPAGDAPTCGFF